ncbi:hypothetical protein AB0E08_49850 [Streptomyces sp. NPDC048281]|uniref:hypothetical protein n=1 Tax=Streptomyces sp. NPDC048281 TaxID=3154715 RepID=UPI00344A21FB
MTRGIDLADGGTALAIAILPTHDQPLHYISGRAVHRASESYPGEGKTEPRTPPSSPARSASAATRSP